MMTNILRILKKDHKEAKSLFHRIEMTADKRIRQRLFFELKNALDAHTLAEEEVLYRRMHEIQGDNKNLKEEMLESFEEHRIATLLMIDLASLSTDHESWLAKVKVFKNIFERHVKMEERVLFKKVRRRFNETDLRKMGLEYISRRDEFRDEYQDEYAVRSIFR